MTNINFQSTAANGTFINNGSLVTGAKGGLTLLTGATAANGTFINNGASVAGGGGGTTEFFSSSTAGSATLIANGGTGGGEGGQIIFGGNSTGGTARIELFGNGTLDIQFSQAPGGVTVGSIEGDGIVLLGARSLGVGSNSLTTTFSGAIQDAGLGGSLTKVGSGTLILSGANTYSGTTKVNGGVLQVDGSIASNTVVFRPGTLTGTGIIHGDVTNRGILSPGNPVGTLTVDNFTRNYRELMIQIANNNEFGVLNVLGTANLSGRLDAVLLNGFVPELGDSFTFLTAGSLNGTLFMFNRNIDNLALHWDISYFPTFAVLTVAAGNVPVPDYGSTLLLLVVSLFGLLMCRRLSCELRN
jgi:autotransporter-associated beta strand protein